MTILESRMVLHRFMCDQFGHKNLRAMLDCFNRLPEECMNNNASRFADVLTNYLGQHTGKVTRDDLARYDENIIAHSRSLGMIGDRRKSWKPFQYLALLFTERYLDLYFQDAEVLIAELNNWLKDDRANGIPEYTADDIHTLAFQSATGSGKTLLLHANILQYKHYLEQTRQLYKLNKIILVTPDEGLSHQHLRELQASGISAQLFSDQQDSQLYIQVDIIDLHKLAEKKGIKRVALESFEENNLVLVDEGHLGTGGKVWRRYRKQLARNGFTFEYSATFNQAVAGSTPEIKKLRDEYGKSILFDYSYKFFYEDGYGKDYHISNLQQTDDGEANNQYLLACLLTFYQQCKIYRDKGEQWRDFNLSPPLWVFLGKTVTSSGRTNGISITETAKTDVVRIVNFLAWVLAKPQQVANIIKRLISDSTGLLDKGGTDIFGRSFSYIKEMQPQQIYDDLCTTVFHGKGRLHISHLTGMSELQLAAGNGKPFGVINVGDASGLYTKLEASENSLFKLSKNAFDKPLFDDVDKGYSPVNMVIGARKFAAGWNSWRVSTMGLMHVGTGEGPQIIQMFGRGIRLKGHGMSLKRHTTLEDVKPGDSHLLKLLETLNIFGLKANYMDKFKEYLQKEGIKVDQVTFSLRTKKRFSNIKGLKIIKKDERAGDFQYSKERVSLGLDGEEVMLDRYKHVQAIESSKLQIDSGAHNQNIGNLEQNHLALVNRQTIYHKILQRKRISSWHNMEISQEMVNTLLDNTSWYTLCIPPEKLEPSCYGRVREWESLAVDLISKYADRYWRKERSAWENKYMKAVPLKKENLNYVEEYELSVGAKKENLIRNIKQFVERVNQGDYNQDFDSEQVRIAVLSSNFHAYIPLLHVNEQEFVRVTPTPLNAGEVKFVKCLKEIMESNNDFIRGKELCLLRNMSRGRGIYFFNDYGFYPDFILWVKQSERQDILFIDPKGLTRFNAMTRSKTELHTQIKDVEQKIQKKHSKLFLHSYIWSNTEPKDIGTDHKLSLNECHKKGIFIASRGSQELIALMKHALG